MSISVLRSSNTDLELALPEVLAAHADVDEGLHLLVPGVSGARHLAPAAGRHVPWVQHNLSPLLPQKHCLEIRLAISLQKYLLCRIHLLLLTQEVKPFLGWYSAGKSTA